MRRETAELLVCPVSGGAVELTETHELDVDRDEVIAGVLTSEGSSYPVLAGIPVLLPDQDEALSLLRSGHHDEAVVLVAFGHLPESRVIPLLDAAGAATRAVRPATAALGRKLRSRQLSRWAEVMRTDQDPFWPVRFQYLDSRLRTVDAYNYFRFRLGTPRHLVALELFDAVRPGPGPILDVGCGCGHVTASLAVLHADRDVVAVDQSLAMLLTARRLLGHQVELVCADGDALPFRDGTCGLVSSCDVLQYSGNAWANARELRRVAGRQGVVIASALRNRNQTHVYGGRTLSPQRWSALLDGASQVTWSDVDLLDAYLAGRHPDEGGSTSGRLEAAQTVSIVAGDSQPVLAGGERSGWPHALGKLGVNPLYRAETATPDDVSFHLAWPSANYQRDNELAARYLPERFTLSTAAVEAGRNQVGHPELDAAVARGAVLGLPPGQAGDAWDPRR
jgi:SAM-dependent methyltransferase/uncharacterized protein YbaR (Trm112 family)